jgi:hypothetical protein
MTNIRLTGRTRFRAQRRLFRSPVLVLQVEWHEWGTHYSPDPGDIHGTDVNRVYWTDARVEDMGVFVKGEVQA